MKVKTGILLPTREVILGKDYSQGPNKIFEMARYAESNNIDSLWVGDSILAKPRIDPLITLSSLAAITKTIGLGTSIYIPALRNPIVLAHTVMSTNFISQGRLIFGVGAGGTFNENQKHEWQSLNIDPSTRGSRLDEMLDILNMFSKDDEIEFRGRHFKIDSKSIFNNIEPAQNYPILCVSHGRSNIKKQFIRAAKHQGLISISDYPNEFKFAINQMNEYGNKFNKVGKKYQSVFYMTININNDVRKAEQEADSFIKSYYGVNIWGDRWGPFGESTKIIDKTNQYIESGATTIIFRFASFNQMEQLYRFCDQIQKYIL
ncbi:MAG: hypothetical protein CL768_01330 [Chloroflexi bacterium]|nr:hypothetical protein [Chloroflexota bacterium]